MSTAQPKRPIDNVSGFLATTFPNIDILREFGSNTDVEMIALSLRKFSNELLGYPKSSEDAQKTISDADIESAKRKVDSTNPPSESQLRSLLSINPAFRFDGITATQASSEMEAFSDEKRLKIFALLSGMKPEDIQDKSILTGKLGENFVRNLLFQFGKKIYKVIEDMIHEKFPLQSLVQLKKHPNIPYEVIEYSGLFLKLRAINERNSNGNMKTYSALLSELNEEGFDIEATQQIRETHAQSLKMMRSNYPVDTVFLRQMGKGRTNKMVVTGYDDVNFLVLLMLLPGKLRSFSFRPEDLDAMNKAQD